MKKQIQSLSALLSEIGVSKTSTLCENRFCPKSIGEDKRTTHLVVQADDYPTYESSLSDAGYEKTNLKHLHFFEKEFESEKVRVWSHPNENYNSILEFVENFIYQKYSQTLI